METEIVKAALPSDHKFSEQIFSTFPSLDPQDIADLVEHQLSAPPYVQLQDLQVTHVLSGMRNNYSEESKENANDNITEQTKL